MEGKSVKQRFDDIFASTRYVKALEDIRKLRKTQTTDLKVNQNNLLHLKKYKERAAELQRTLDDVVTRHAAAEDSLKNIRSQIKPVEVGELHTV